MQTTIDSIITITEGTEVTVIGYSKVEVITVATAGPQGPKGDSGDGVDFYTKEMGGLSSTFDAVHNLGRLVTVAKLQQPDGTVISVSFKNQDSEGNVSQNAARIEANFPLVGILTLM